MARAGLGKPYKDGETIVQQGEMGDCMYVVQSGRVEVVRTEDSHEVKLAELPAGAFFGEMALFEKEVRSATVRAVGDVRVLTVDKRTLLRRIKEDPFLAVNILQTMSGRIRDLNSELMRLSAGAGTTPDGGSA